MYPQHLRYNKQTKSQDIYQSLSIWMENMNQSHARKNNILFSQFSKWTVKFQLGFSLTEKFPYQKDKYLLVQ